MMSQAGLQTITLHILPSISQSKGNQAMIFGQLIEYDKRNIFLQKSWRKWGRETSSSLLFVFKKALCKRKAYGQFLVLIYFGRARLGHTIKINCTTFQTADLEICSILIF